MDKDIQKFKKELLNKTVEALKKRDRASLIDREEIKNSIKERNEEKTKELLGSAFKKDKEQTTNFLKTIIYDTVEDFFFTYKILADEKYPDYSDVLIVRSNGMTIYDFFMKFYKKFNEKQIKELFSFIAKKPVALRTEADILNYIIRNDIRAQRIFFDGYYKKKHISSLVINHILDKIIKEEGVEGVKEAVLSNHNSEYRNFFSIYLLHSKSNFIKAIKTISQLEGGARFNYFDYFSETEKAVLDAKKKYENLLTYEDVKELADTSLIAGFTDREIESMVSGVTSSGLLSFFFVVVLNIIQSDHLARLAKENSKYVILMNRISKYMLLIDDIKNGKESKAAYQNLHPIIIELIKLKEGDTIKRIMKKINDTPNTGNFLISVLDIYLRENKDNKHLLNYFAALASLSKINTIPNKHIQFLKSPHYGITSALLSYKGKLSNSEIKFIADRTLEIKEGDLVESQDFFRTVRRTLIGKYLTVLATQDDKYSVLLSDDLSSKERTIKSIKPEKVKNLQNISTNKKIEIMKNAGIEQSEIDKLKVNKNKTKKEKDFGKGIVK